MAGMEGARGFDDDEDFYEEDEPLEKIVAAFEHGEHGVTAPPVSVDTHGLGSPRRPTATRLAVVTLGPAPVLPLQVRVSA